MPFPLGYRSYCTMFTLDHEYAFYSGKPYNPRTSHSTAHCDCLRAACRSESQQIDGRFCLHIWGSTQPLHQRLLGTLAQAVERMKFEAELSSIYLWFINIAFKSLNYITPYTELILRNKSDSICKETVVAYCRLNRRMFRNTEENHGMYRPEYLLSRAITDSRTSRKQSRNFNIFSWQG